MADKPYRDKEWLLEKYYTEGLTTVEMAELPESCNRRALNTWFNRNNIQRIQIPELPYESLVEQYESGASIHDLADKYDVDAGTISKRLKSMGCVPDNSGPNKKHPAFNLHDNGYGNFYERAQDGDKQVYIHQLLMIAKGADPWEVFSSREYHVHHKNGLCWDNRHENVELLTAEEHGKHHN